VKQADDAITREDLKELVAVFREAIAEGRKPPEPTEEEAAEIAQRKAALAVKQEERLANSKAHQENLRNKAHSQTVCSHMHSSRIAGFGQSHMTHVRDNGVGDGLPGFLYCQRCELRLRPESGELWHKLDPGATFNTEQFNWYYQTAISDQGGIID
jgi:hypothetical protein